MDATKSPSEPYDEALALFMDIYRVMLFFLALYVCGDVVCGRLIRVIPPLVGHIAVGMLFGPHVGFAWIDESWPALLGEVGLILFLCQAGLEMDFQVLRQVGPRGALMAVAGSLFPTSIGFLLAYTVLDLNLISSLAVGCSFGPTSAGIALNVLQECKVLSKPLGQLVVAIAIVDDIIALVVLSQLKALTAETIQVTSIVFPIISAVLWLFFGVGLAMYGMPFVLHVLERLELKFFAKFCLRQEGTGSKERLQGTRLTYVVALLFVLLPATYFSQASHLLGAFLAGLSFCKEDVSSYNEQFGNIIAWLMRIFFGASIAFAVPVQLFADRTVVRNGCLLMTSLLGKIMIGPLLTPHFREETIEPTTRSFFGRTHIRDCLVVGFSMAGEAEFAMLVAAYGYAEGIVSEDIYASTLFAILASTILSPCLLRTTFALFPAPDNIEAREDSKKTVDGNLVDGNEEFLANSETL